MKNKSKQKQEMYRQGDVLLVPVKSIPTGLTKTDRVTLAFGEVTGHHHTIERNAIGYATGTDKAALAEYVEVTAPADLVHQEHNPITIPPGKYKATIQVEYTPGEIRRVAD